MTKFHDYAVKVDAIARESFKEYEAAAAAVEKARAEAKAHPQKVSYGTDYEEAAKVAQAQANLINAQNALKRAQDNMRGRKIEIEKLRKELAKDLSDHYAADPSKIDSNTIELMKSGILSADEYRRLLHSAQEAGNYTMTRMIAKYAGTAAEAAGKEYGENSQQAMDFRAIAYNNNQNGSDELAKFDLMANCYSRTAENPAMIDAWTNLMGETIENF